MMEMRNVRVMDSDGDEQIGEIGVEAEGDLIHLSATDEDGKATLALDIAEAERLLVELAIAIAEARRNA